MISPLRLMFRTACFHWRMNVVVACGVAVGSAVLTGALLVGDSMQGSLRTVALGGLGRIDDALVASRFFRQDLATEAGPGAAPAILLRGSMESADREPATYATQVNLIGCDERFWELGDRSPPPLLRRGEIVLNQPLAMLLGVKVGDSVIVRLPRAGAIPSESALGRKKDTVGIARAKISAIITTDGLGRFSLQPTQQSPRNAYMALSDLQQQIEESDRVDAIFRQHTNDPPEWRPQLADYGIQVVRSPLNYWNITSDQMIFKPAVERELLDKLNGLTVQPALTYLANTIACGERQIPYSTVAAIDFTAEPPLGPFTKSDGLPATKLDNDEIALNDWAAKQLKASIGEKVRLTFFEPESIHGTVRERTVEFRLAAIVPLQGAAADKGFTPTVRGLTDQKSIQDWDPPFPFESKRIRSVDDQYWKKYRATPKAFVSLATGRRLWSSRFGQTTSLRVKPEPGMTAETLQTRLNLDPVAQGFVFQPIRKEIEKASAGATPFGVLFLSFSFFVIVAALMLVALLFRLAVELRAKQLGLLTAVGFRPRQILAIVIGEGFIIALAGSAPGTLAGVAYAELMLWGLRNWWTVIGTPYLTLHVSATSCAIGFLAGLTLAMIVIWFSVRNLGRIPPRSLLAGQATKLLNSPVGSARSSVVGRALQILRQVAIALLPRKIWQAAVNPYLLLLLAVVPAAILLFLPLSEESRIGAFFGAGALSLTALLAFVHSKLKAGATGSAVSLGSGNLWRMARRNAARHPGRSVLAAGLVASACFLIVSVSAFHLDPSREMARTSGNGGFSLLGQSDQAIYQDLNTPEGRKELGISSDDNSLLAQCKFYAFRLKPGDDASCLNLYKARQPRVLGVPESFIERGGFGWAVAPRCENPWQLLKPRATGDENIPTILDQTTAIYALELWKGRGECYLLHDSQGRNMTLQVAALLQDSIFQGDLLVSEQSLLRHEPNAAGYGYFLIEAPANRSIDVQQALQRALADYGFSTETTIDRLATLSAVQNTYLSAFQSLGGLGLLLGAVGLAVVEWRNIVERRGELALLRAAGFSVKLLSILVALENILLLALGLGVGLAAAAVAVLPHLISRASSLPLASLGLIFGSIFAVGLVASLLVTRQIVKSPILAALREEK